MLELPGLGKHNGTTKPESRAKSTTASLTRI
jgi:hypothetical protein